MRSVKWAWADRPTDREPRDWGTRWAGQQPARQGHRRRQRRGQERRTAPRPRPARSQPDLAGRYL